MNLNLILPFLSTAVMVVFTISVLNRWRARRKQHFLFWGIGLGMFTLGSFAESYFAIVGWSAFIFFVWYFFGAVLNAAYIGHGTFLLLFRKSWARIVTAVLVVASIIALVLMLRIMPRLDPTIFSSGAPISEQYQEIMPAISDGATVRLTTPFFNIYGLLTLVGGALWSAWLFLRKRALPNRVLGNVLIAAGALSIGLASTATRLGAGGYLYLGELIAAVLMYAGFMLAGRPVVEEESAPEPASVAA
ncbi:MAG: hypothetical protein ACE5JF_04815 [Anaerolineales bacterium]